MWKNFSYPNAPMHSVDIDGDGKKEMIVVHFWMGQYYIAVYKSCYGQRQMITRIDGRGYGIKDLRFADLTGDGRKEIIIGWQISPTWGQLEIYKWQRNRLRRIIQDVSYSKLHITGEINEDDSKKRILVLWQDEKTHTIEILRWDGKGMQLSSPSKEELLAVKNKIKKRGQQKESMQKKQVKLYPASVKEIGGTRWGYIDEQGGFQIPPHYTRVEAFQDNGLAVVTMDGQSGLIDTRGQFIVKPIYDSISPFSEGRAVALDQQGFKVIDETGQVIFSSAEYIDSFHEGRAVFGKANEQQQWKYGYIDRQGNVIITPRYEMATAFQNQRAVVQSEENRFHLIDLQGDILQTYPYGLVREPSEGLLLFKETTDGMFGYINEKGEVLISPKFTGAQSFQDERAVVNISQDIRNAYGLIDPSGNYVIQPQYNDILQLGEGRVGVGRAIDPEKPFMGSKYAIADLQGNLLTEFRYENLTSYHKGYLSVTENGRTFFIDRSGKREEELPVLEGIGTLSMVGDLIRADINMRTSYYTPSGQVIWKQNTEIPLSQQYKVEEEEYFPNKDYLVYYPQVLGMDNKEIQEMVNEKLKESYGANKAIDSHVQLESSYQGDFDVTLYKEDLVEFLQEGYDYTFGAAHGMPTKIYYHVDLKSGEFYQLEDLFKKDSNYVEILSGIIRKQIEAQGEDSVIWLDQYKGIQPNQPFYITENALYIYFTPYEIAPYAAGFPTFKIPFVEIMELIDQEGEFWEAFHL